MTTQEDNIKAWLGSEMQAEGLVRREDGMLVIQDDIQNRFMVELTVLDITEDEK